MLSNQSSFERFRSTKRSGTELYPRGTTKGAKAKNRIIELWSGNKRPLTRTHDSSVLLTHDWSEPIAGMTTGAKCITCYVKSEGGEKEVFGLQN